MADKYITLIASLPHLGQLFTATQTPLSRLKLENQLTLLETEDATLLRQIEDLLRWSSLERTDAEIVATARRLLQQLPSPVLRDVVQFWLELRTAVAALRRRKRGEGPPQPGELWGYGRWIPMMVSHWSEPGFRLEGVFPWILEANRFWNVGDSMSLERLLFGAVWNKLSLAAAGHEFDFEAVALYVLRWNLMDWWTSYDGKTAVKRFTALVDTGIGEFTTVFA